MKQKTKTPDTKILVINANPKTSGTLVSLLNDFSRTLSVHGVRTETINLIEHEIKDCFGCQQCVKSGNCSIKDDMERIIKRIHSADGYVIGSSIRDGYTTALFKKFCERTSYLLGFTRGLFGKPVVGVATVGFAGGKRQAKNLLTMRNCGAEGVGFLYERVGFEKRIRNPRKLKLKIDKAAEKLIREARRQKNADRKNKLGIGDTFFSIFLSKMKKHLPYIYQVWKEKGWIK